MSTDRQRTWCGVTGCRLKGVGPHMHEGGSPEPTPLRRPLGLSIQAHELQLDKPATGIEHELGADCWCGPTVHVVHRAIATESTSHTIRPDVVSLDQHRTRAHE